MASDSVLTELPVGPCPACGSNEIALVNVDGYGRTWICECGRQVPVPTLPREVIGTVIVGAEVEWIAITPAEAFDLLTLVATVDDRAASEQATIDRLAAALEARR